MIKLVKGFHDILPDEALKWDYLINRAEGCLERYGFRRIITPVMEKTELFERGIGEVTDIVEKEMYTFEDKSGERLSLRPEATAGVLRAVVEHSMLRREPVLKLYTTGPMFRRERPSKGRFRQFFQINAEILGDDSPQTDAESIAAAHAMMSEIGAKGLVMEVNSVGCRDCREVYKEKLKSYLKNNLDDLCPDCRRRFDTNPLRILDCKAQQCIDIRSGAPVITDSLDDQCRSHYREVLKCLKQLNIPFAEEPTMVRGLDYYTRTAFEIIHSELGRSKAVGGGGRYDSLLAELGGPDETGIGFAVGIERVVMGIPDREEFGRAIDAYVAILEADGLDKGFELLHQLRAAGLRAEARFNLKSLKSQMKTADKLGAKAVIMLGVDELAKGAATVRNMKTKEQTPVEFNDLAGYLQGE
jgi:histidyl-tRNA synthetase